MPLGVIICRIWKPAAMHEFGTAVQAYLHNQHVKQEKQPYAS